MAENEKRWITLVHVEASLDDNTGRVTFRSHIDSEESVREFSSPVNTLRFGEEVLSNWLEAALVMLASAQLGISPQDVQRLYNAGLLEDALQNAASDTGEEE